MTRLPRSCALLALAAAAGCTPYQPPQEADNLRPEEPEYVMVVVIDMSGSYAQHLKDGKAWHAVNAMVRKFFRDRAGEADKIVVAQISSTPRGPIWSGSPKAFKAQFGGPEAFKKLLDKHTGASRVYDSISEAVEYAMPLMGKGRAGCFIFSDMLDNLSAPGGEERLVKALGEFSRKGGSVGIYWCDFDMTGPWREKLTGAVRRFVISADIDADPQLPSWE